MDVLAVTNFPDIRLKSAIHSASEGSALIIPREGGYLFRIYIELDKLSEDERVSSLNLTSEDLVAAAQRILVPYSFDVKEIVGWSAYEIGQRLCDRFDDLPDDAGPNQVPRVFIAGDACRDARRLPIPDRIMSAFCDATGGLAELTPIRQKRPERDRIRHHLCVHHRRNRGAAVPSSRRTERAQWAARRQPPDGGQGYDRPEGEGRRPHRATG